MNNNKVVFLSVGSRGDIQPLVAIANNLKSLGVKVKFCTHKEYSYLPEQNGLEFAEIPRNPAKIWAAKRVKKEKSKSLWEQIEPDATFWLKAGLKHTQGANAIVYNALYIVGQHLGEKLNIPYFPVIFEPNIPTKEFPIPYFPIQKNMGALLNKITYFLGPQLFWQMIRKNMNIFRAKELNLPPISWKGPINKLVHDEVPIIGCFSKFLAPKPKDWNNNINVTGYCFLDKDKEDRSYPELEIYLDQKKPIFIDLGSFSSDKLIPKIKIILKDLDQLSENILIAPGGIDFKELVVPENCFILEKEAPHSWLLPKVKAIISHGGVGVVHSALRAGIPNIPITIFAAQYYWGYKIYQNGLGSMPIRMMKLKEGDIIKAITYINNKIIGSRKLSYIKKLVEDEDGAKMAAQYIVTKLESS